MHELIIDELVPEAQHINFNIDKLVYTLRYGDNNVRFYVIQSKGNKVTILTNILLFYKFIFLVHKNQRLF